MTSTCGDNCIFPVANLTSKGMQTCDQKCSYYGNYNKPSGNNTIGFATDFDGNFDETLNLLVTTYDFTFTSVGYGDKIIKQIIIIMYM